MQTLSTNDLDHVTGGKSPLGGNIGGGSDDALLTTLQGIQSSLKDLGKNQNQGLFGGSSGLLFMTMAVAMSNRQSSVVVHGHGSCNKRGFCFRW